MSWHIVLNFLNACGTFVDAQFIVGADNPAIGICLRRMGPPHTLQYAEIRDGAASRGPVRLQSLA